MSVTDRKLDKNAGFIRKTAHIGMGPIAVSMTHALKNIIYPRHDFEITTVDWWSRDETGTVTAKVLVAARAGSGLVAGTPGLAIHSIAEQFKITNAIGVLVAGAYAQKAAASGLTFTAAHVVSATKFGVILVQMTVGGTVSTKVPSATQAYASANAALAALPSPDANNIALGYIAIAADSGDWTANTDDLTNGSDLTTATFTDAVPISRTVLGSDIAFSDGGAGTGVTLSTTLANLRGQQDDAIFVVYTSDGTGALVDAAVNVAYRPYGVVGDAATIR